MRVYLVESICDYEYGCREVEAVCATKESAEAYIEEHGGNHDEKFWTGEIFPYYTIEEWEVKEALDNLMPMKHGKWIDTEAYTNHYVHIYECSNCHNEVADDFIVKHTYCLHCGAKMDGNQIGVSKDD